MHINWRFVKINKKSWNSLVETAIDAVFLVPNEVSFFHSEFVEQNLVYHKELFQSKTTYKKTVTLGEIEESYSTLTKGTHTIEDTNEVTKK